MRMLESGPLPISEVVRRLDEHALLEELRGECADEEDLGEAVIDELLVSDAVWATPAGVVARTDRLLDGFVLTHRVTARELANGELNLCPDLRIPAFPYTQSGVSVRLGLCGVLFTLP